MTTAELLTQAQAAMRAGDVAGALALVAQAEAGAPADPAPCMQRAMIHRMTGNLAAAAEALDDALVIDPYDFVALLSKGAVIERLHGEKAAAAIYRNVLKIAPPDLPPPLAAGLERAREVVAKTDAALEDYLRKAVGALDIEVGGAGRRRFEEGLGIFVGRIRPFVQEPILLHYPRLPAIPFYDRSLFPWLPELEASTAVIQEELAGALAEAHDDFAPYIQYPKGAPVNQWGELNHSRLWSSYFLWKDGTRQAGACAKCPKTAALLESLPIAYQPGFAPTAMFSALDAHTAIPPHTGSANTRLIVHLPLVLPGPAGFRVGNETREWKIGEAWVFDDTIEHEAWNNADEMRTILIFDVWNPFLELGERELITEMMAAKNRFMAS